MLTDLLTMQWPRQRPIRTLAVVLQVLPFSPRIVEIVIAREEYNFLPARRRCAEARLLQPLRRVLKVPRPH